MFLCNLLLFNYQVITVLMNLIEMLISDSDHTQKRRLHLESFLWMGPNLFIWEEMTSQSSPLLWFPLWKFLQVQGHSFHHSYTINSSLSTNSCYSSPCLHEHSSNHPACILPFTKRILSVTFLNEDKITIKIKIPIAYR